MRSLLSLTLAAGLVVALAACDAADPQADGPTAFAGPDLADARATTVRPISEFLDANDSGCYYLWSEVSDRPSNGRRVFFDYSGVLRNSVLAQSGGVDLPTEFSGTVRERALRDGSAEVHVTLHARNAFAYSDAGSPGGFAPLMGYWVTDVAAGTPPTLVDGSLDITYVNPAGPGAPLQNICSVGDFSRSRIVVNGSGDLRSGFDGANDGDPGQISVNQNGVFSPGQGKGVSDGFPVEFVNIRPTGD